MRARPRSGEKRGGFWREWRRSEEVERERERLGSVALEEELRGAGRGWEWRGAEERGWSLRARILGFQLVLYDRSVIRAIRLEMDG